MEIREPGCRLVCETSLSSGKLMKRLRFCHGSPDSSLQSLLSAVSQVLGPELCSQSPSHATVCLLRALVTLLINFSLPFPQQSLVFFLNTHQVLKQYIYFKNYVYVCVHTCTCTHVWVFAHEYRCLQRVSAHECSCLQRQRHWIRCSWS